MLRGAMQNLRRVFDPVGSPARLCEPASSVNAAASTTHPFDEANGLDTSGYVPLSDSAQTDPVERHSSGYYASAPSLVRGMLDRWAAVAALPIERYTFVDIGSGKGRAVLLASERRFRQCVGVELDPSLHEAAVANRERWMLQGRATCPIEMLCEEATAYTFPMTPCLLYLFHPFTCEVFARLLDRLEVAFAHRTGALDLLYVNAQCQHLLQQRPGFARLWQQGIAMSPEDAAADLLYEADAAGGQRYGAATQEPCSAWRWIGRPAS